MNGLKCLMLEGPGINADIRNELLLATARMRREMRTRISVKTKYFDGWIKTKHETRVLGSLSGLLFDAEIEFERGKSSIRFIVNERDLLQARPDDLEVMSWINLLTGEMQMPEKL